MNMIDKNTPWGRGSFLQINYMMKYHKKKGFQKAGQPKNLKTYNL